MLLNVVRGLRRARAPLGALTLLAAACAGAVATPAFAAPGTPVVGYFQSRNIRWGIPPQVLSPIAQRTEAMHFGPNTHAADQNHMSTTFFPMTNLQLPGINQLRFNFYLPAGSACAGGSPRIVVVVDDPANPSPAGQEKQIHAYPDASVCSTKGSWQTIDMLAPGIRWNAAQLGGGSNLTRAQADAAARAQLTEAYKVTRVRINFDGGAGPEAWFDNFVVNNYSMMDRTMDTSPESQQPEAGALPAAAPTAGYFVVRTAKWAPKPDLLKNTLQVGQKNEALHYSPASRSENADFMSTSFFPQQPLTLDGIKRLDFDILIKSGTCGPNSPRVVAVIQAASKPGQALQLEGQHPGCVVGSWKTLNFLDAGVAWSIPGRISSASFAAARQSVKLWAGDATVQVLRVSYLGNTADVWIDNHHVNEMTLAERAQDFSLPSQLPAPGVRGDGFVAHVDFPGNTSAITADGTIVLTADASRRIRVRVRPYFDSDRDGLYNPDGTYHVATYPAVLNVAFFDHANQQHLYAGRGNGLTHTGNGFYEGTVTLPAGFQGGAYMVAVNDNNVDGDSGADNRASYFFLPKELMLRNGDAGMAPFADLLDTPGMLAPAVAGMLPVDARNGYEGPRSPVIIAPAN